MGLFSWVATPNLDMFRPLLSIVWWATIAPDFVWATMSPHGLVNDLLGRSSLAQIHKLLDVVSHVAKPLGFS